ncbi:MAG: hypothetical protein AB8D52_08745 [Gammaproteobacteria bacterium]
MHKLIPFILLASIFILPRTSFAVSPWMLSEGEIYYSAVHSYSTNDRGWDESSQLRDSSCRSQTYRSNHQLEYGYSYYHTLTANLDLVDRHCGDEDYRGLGDLRLGIRGRLNVFENGKTWEVTLIVPTGYSRSNRSRPGNGEFGIEGGLAYLSRGELRDFAKRWDFITGVSVRLWAGGPADQFLTYATVRRNIGRYGRLSMGVSADISFQNEGSSSQADFIDGTQLSDYDKLTAKINWADRLTEDWRYKVGASRVVWGRNAGQSVKFSITFSRNWGP